MDKARETLNVRIRTSWQKDVQSRQATPGGQADQLRRPHGHAPDKGESDKKKRGVIDAEVRRVEKRTNLRKGLSSAA